MIAAVFRTAVWLGAAHALAGGLVLGFLYTPESNVLMLGVSALLLALALTLLVLSSAAAADGLVRGRAPWASVGAAARHLPLAVVVVMILVAIVGAAEWFEWWWMSRGGEMDAAAIAAGDITRTGPAHDAVHWAVVLVQWVLVPAWLATALAWTAGYEPRDVLTLKWLTAGLDWRLVLVTAAAVALLVWVPWRYVYWRPRILPASGTEVAFTGAKLLVIYMLSQIGWAATLWTAARRVPAPAALDR